MRSWFRSLFFVFFFCKMIILNFESGTIVEKRRGRKRERGVVEVEVERESASFSYPPLPLSHTKPTLFRAPLCASFVEQRLVLSSSPCSRLLCSPQHPELERTSAQLRERANSKKGKRRLRETDDRRRSPRGLRSRQNGRPRRRRWRRRELCPQAPV